MTINEFIEKLEKTPRRWRLTKRGLIRCGDSRCPIVTVAGPHYSTSYPWGAIRHLGIGERTAQWILGASDNPVSSDSFNTKYLRVRLLKACGLGGEATER